MSTEKIVTREILTKPVPGYEGLYEVSNDGRVWSLNYHRQGIRKELSGRSDKDGYLDVGLRRVGVKRKYIRIHRLVAIAFIPNPDNLPEVNHKDGVKTNNVVNNLEWVTTKQNINHSWELGRKKVIPRSQQGELNNASKLTEKQVIDIWKLKGVMTQREIAERVGVKIGSVDNVHSQKSWKYLTDELIEGERRTIHRRYGN